MSSNSAAGVLTQLIGIINIYEHNVELELFFETLLIIKCIIGKNFEPVDPLNNPDVIYI